MTASSSEPRSPCCGAARAPDRPRPARRQLPTPSRAVAGRARDAGGEGRRLRARRGDGRRAAGRARARRAWPSPTSRKASALRAGRRRASPSWSWPASRPGRRARARALRPHAGRLHAADARPALDRARPRRRPPARAREGRHRHGRASGFAADAFVEAALAAAPTPGIEVEGADDPPRLRRRGRGGHRAAARPLRRGASARLAARGPAAAADPRRQQRGPGLRPADAHARPPGPAPLRRAAAAAARPRSTCARSCSSRPTSRWSRTCRRARAVSYGGAVGGAAPVPHRHHPHRLRGRRPAHRRACATTGAFRGRPGARAGRGHRVHGPHHGRRHRPPGRRATATRPSSSATTPRPGTWPTGRARTPGRS